MYKKKSLFVTFEGIEGSGKSYQARKLYRNIKKKKISPILTREPGGTKSACLLYTSPSPRDATLSRMPSSA